MICTNFTGEAQDSVQSVPGICVQCTAEQQRVRSLWAGIGTPAGKGAPPGGAVGSEHTSEAQENKEV